MPGLPARPGTPVPAGSAYSKARERSGEAPARAMFGADAARGDIPAGQDGTIFGLEITRIDGTTLELFNDPLLAEESGVPAPGAKPLLRLVGLLHSGTRRRKAAVIGRYLDGENALADELESSFGPGAAEPRRPRLLLHGPLHPVLERRRAPAVARQERREVRPLQDP
jgi:hypothetical protein